MSPKHRSVFITPYNVATVCNKLILPGVRSEDLLMQWFLRKGQGSSLVNVVIHFRWGGGWCKPNRDFHFHFHIHSTWHSVLVLLCYLVRSESIFDTNTISAYCNYSWLDIVVVVSYIRNNVKSDQIIQQRIWQMYDKC